MRKIIMIAIAGIITVATVSAQGNGGRGGKTAVVSKNTPAPTAKKDGTAHNEKSAAIDTTKKGKSNSSPKTQGKGTNTSTNVKTNGGVGTSSGGK